MYFYSTMMMWKNEIKILILMLVFLSAGRILFGQDKRSKIARPEANIDLLLDTAEVKMNRDMPEAFDYIQQALATSISNGDRYGEARSYQLLARTHYDLEQFDLALNYFRKALKLKEVFSNDELMKLYSEYALALEQENNPAEAVRNLNRAIVLAQSSGNTQEEINLRYELARIYEDQNDDDAALKEYTAIEDLENMRQNLRGVAVSNNMQGKVLFKQKKSQEAISNYEDAERIAEQINAEDLRTTSLRNQAAVYRSNQQYNQELEVRQEALEISNKNEQKKEAVEDNLMLGDLYLETEQPEEALPYIQRSIDLAEETGDLTSKGTALKKLSEVYDKQGAYDKALLSYKQYATTMDSVYAYRGRELQKNLDRVAEVNRKLQRIELLEQDYELTIKTVELLEKEQQFTDNEQVFMQRKLSFQRWLSFGLVILVLGLAVATFLIWRSSVQKRKANLLLALRSLRSQMNPHFIFNSLNSVNSYIASNNERQANKYLSDFARLMRQVLENSKHDFVTVSSEVEVLTLYLKLEHSRFSEKFDYDFEVDEALRISDLSIPPMLIQPYIENAIWHGLRYREEKGKLEVILKLEGNMLQAEVRDNGIGRAKSQALKTPHQQQNKSIGMKNTRSRLEIINEVYDLNYEVSVEDLDPETSTGTRVKLKIPMETAKIKD